MSFSLPYRPLGILKAFGEIKDFEKLSGIKPDRSSRPVRFRLPTNSNLLESFSRATQTFQKLMITSNPPRFPKPWRFSQTQLRVLEFTFASGFSGSGRIGQPLGVMGADSPARTAILEASPHFYLLFRLLSGPLGALVRS